MKKGTLITIIVVAILGLLVIWGVGKYNAIVTAEENVETAWAQVEAQYQRRADLIPNLVNTVKGYTAHENSTLEAVVAARAKATSFTVDAANLTPTQLADYQAAQGELGTALGRLLAITEAYPDLKANTNFLDLQKQLEGTENRIATARMAFNDTARSFNTLIRRFPTNIIANIGGFEKKPYFEAEVGADKAPEVVF